MLTPQSETYLHNGEVGDSFGRISTSIHFSLDQQGDH